MEIVNLPRISDYWSTADNFLKTYVWSNTMSKNQFLLLLRFWHFEIEGDNERLNNKVAHLMNNLHEKVKKNLLSSSKPLPGRMYSVVEGSPYFIQ